MNALALESLGELDDIDIVITLLLQVLLHPGDSWIVRKNAHVLQLIQDYFFLDCHVICFLAAQIKDVVDILKIFFEAIHEFKEAFQKFSLESNNLAVVSVPPKSIESFIESKDLEILLIAEGHG